MLIHKRNIYLLILLSMILLVTAACGTFQVGIVSSEDDLPVAIATQKTTSDDMVAFEPTPAPKKDSASMQVAESTTPVEDIDESADHPEDWMIYTNDTYRYEFAYPRNAKITTLGPQGFSQAELPEGMEPGEYMSQLAEEYSDELCVIVEYVSGFVSISAPPNQFYHYTNCNNPAPGAGEMINKTETININGETYEASGFEFIPTADNPDGHFEYFSITLEDGTLISYGSSPGTSGDYQDFLAHNKEILLQIIDSFTAVVVEGPEASGSEATANWVSYENVRYNFGFSYPEGWNLTEDGHIVELTKGTLFLRVAFSKKEESISLVPGEWPTGSIPPGEEVQRGEVQFIGQSIPRVELIVEGAVVAVFYNGEPVIRTPHGDFMVSLDDLSAEEPKIDTSDQQEVDSILETFHRLY
jgi:hypothetical protein